MVQDRHERQQGAAGTGESPNEKQTGPSRQVSGRVYRWPLALATLLLLAASWLAWQQPPHPDAYRSPPAWSSRAFWLYPQEQNAFQRLPQINAVLNSTFSLGQQVWAVGSDGILATADGGKSWQKSTYTRYPSPWFYAATVAALWLYAAAFWWRARANRRARLEVPLRRISNRVVSDKPAGPGSADLLGARQIAQGLTRFWAMKTRCRR